MRSLLQLYSKIDKSWFLYIGILNLFSSFYLLSLLSFILWFIKENIMFDNVSPLDESKYQDIQGKYGILQRRNIDTIVLNKGITNYEKGYAQGELLADKMFVFFGKIKLVLRFLGCHKYKLPENFPDKYKDEIQGLVDGYNSWAIKNNKERINFDFVYTYHCLPDGSTWMGTNSLFRKIFAVGCSVIVRDNIVGRTLDFCPFGRGGSDTFILKDGNTTRLLVPGILGCITGWNGKTFVALNISYSHVKYMQGWPMVFACREILENPTETDFTFKNASSFHVSIFDGNKGRRISFGQGNNDGRLESTGNIVTLNFNYGLFEGDKNTADSLSRKKIIDNFNLNMESLLKHPLINVHDTINSVLYDYNTGKVVLRRNNSFASDEKDFVEFTVNL